ncbi:E3 ubiquitin-protein ligase RHA2A-like [Punica granatum]|uniref:RING-type domain-containing protein n=2 Tax=Punica granatum TaxID=22663 RepID=A0A218W575_PUNGR|nr:E3 ubiquitin-protein ligase RHA2A-like [Punica granatum]OWM68034.1 hypothetical protein CDL15_Pgr017602 [Punica granatum]PKI69433.1 hypothetical protein CRG98_010231 [Punica granatum]
MGIQGQLSDVSSDSIPLLLVALIAGCVNHLRSSILSFLHSLRLHHSPAQAPDDGLLRSLGSGLAGLILLAEQLDQNLASTTNQRSRSSGDCVVCLSELMDGEAVRALACRHVFHKRCFDGWVDRLNFSCPLCRSPVVSGERVEAVQRRVGGDLVAWFSNLR